MINHLSVSCITTYQTCPRMFEFQYIKKAMGLPSKALDIGKYVHEGIELFNSKKDWETILKKKVLVKMNDENVETFRLVRRIVKAYERNPIEGETVQNEVKCEFVLENSTGEKIPLPFLGFIDRMTKRGIVEYKTTGEDYTQEKVDTSLQATIYSYFFYKITNEYPQDITYWIANKKEVMKKDDYIPQILITCRSQADVDSCFQEVKSVYDMIIENKFDVNVGDSCYWCSYRQLCSKK